MAHSPQGIYELYAGVYDRTFGRVLGARLGRAVQQLGVSGGMRVLDVGVGTGLSLDAYPDDVQVVGVDLSPAMLSQAQARVQRGGKDNVQLVRADAERLPFEDKAFDACLLGHVLSVATDPFAVLREVQRVTRPGARVAVVNHFLPRKQLFGRMEQALDPLFVRLGWHAGLTLEQLTEADGLVPVSVEQPPPPALWRTVLLVNTGHAAHPGAQPPAPQPPASA